MSKKDRGIEWQKHEEVVKEGCDSKDVISEAFSLKIGFCLLNYNQLSDSEVWKVKLMARRRGGSDQSGS